MSVIWKTALAALSLHWSHHGVVIKSGTITPVDRDMGPCANVIGSLAAAGSLNVATTVPAGRAWPWVPEIGADWATNGAPKTLTLLVLDVVIEDPPGALTVAEIL